MKKALIALTMAVALFAGIYSVHAQMWMPVANLGFEINLVKPVGVFETGDHVSFLGWSQDINGNPFTPEVRYFAIGPKNFFTECLPVQKLGVNVFICDLEVTSNWPKGSYHAIMTGEKYPHPPQLEFKWNAFKVQ
jgi:hypothetical protein